MPMSNGAVVALAGLEPDETPVASITRHTLPLLHASLRSWVEDDLAVLEATVDSYTEDFYRVLRTIGCQLIAMRAEDPDAWLAEAAAINDALDRDDDRGLSLARAVVALQRGDDGPARAEVARGWPEGRPTELLVGWYGVYWPRLVAAAAVDQR